MTNYDPAIKKEDLVVGAYYQGRCRNASIARWDGEVFLYWRSKFGNVFLEEIHCPEDDPHFDVFVAEERIHEIEKEIPIQQRTLNK